MTVLAVINLKGGAGKTTTVAHVAHALHERGHAVLVVDADPQGSALTWHQAAEWPFPVVALPSPRLHRDIPGIAGDRFGAVLIDTPGTEHGRPIALAAVRAATHVLIPCPPTPGDYERMRDVAALLVEARDLDAVFTVGVLLVRAVTGAASTAVYRTALAGDGWPVLRALAPRLERYAQAFGEHVTGAAGGPYGWAVDELVGA